jgi:16S rRNA (guanine(527)-N(7))-methyltransferase RsmG
MESSVLLKELLAESGIEPDSEMGRGLLRYLDLLEKWNRRMNLTATTEWAALKALFLEGIWASTIYPAESISHLDIGTGAGFPAIILRILIPRIRLQMIESRIKKGVFLERVVQALGLRGVRVHIERLDVLLGRTGVNDVWDCITWKGLRLNTGDLLKLREHVHSNTQFWMFHGSEPAVEEPEALEDNFHLLRNEEFPGKRGWNLSVYLSKTVEGQ